MVAATMMTSIGIAPNATVMSDGPIELPMPTVVGSATIGSRTTTIPPRRRNVARAIGQVAGVARVTRSAASSARPRVMGRGWSMPPG